MVPKKDAQRAITQADKFREAARDLETDESEEHFDALVKKIAKAPQPKDDKPQRRIKE